MHPGSLWNTTCPFTILISFQHLIGPLGNHPQRGRTIRNETILFQPVLFVFLIEFPLRNGTSGKHFMLISATPYRVKPNFSLFGTDVFYLLPPRYTRILSIGFLLQANRDRIQKCNLCLPTRWFRSIQGSVSIRFLTPNCLLRHWAETIRSMEHFCKRNPYSTLSKQGITCKLSRLSIDTQKLCSAYVGK